MVNQVVAKRKPQVNWKRALQLFSTSIEKQESTILKRELASVLGQGWELK